MLCDSAMKKTVLLAGFLVLVGLLFACDTKRSEKIGAAGKAEEMADSTRLDSSVDARNRADGQPSSAHDTT